MKRLFFSMLLFLVSLSIAQQQSVFYVIDYGANPDTSKLSTTEIQEAIDDYYSSGGGYVVFPCGDYLIGTILLKDNVYLRIDPGATIFGITAITDYDPAYLIYANGAKNIGILGPGFINGQADSFWRGKERPYIRPSRTIQFENCQNVIIRDVNIRNSAAFNIAVEMCDQVYISGVSIINELIAPNTDGIDPISSSNVFISDCYIKTGDDCICPKAQDELKSMENLVVTNCVLISDNSALKCGTRSNGTIKKLLIQQYHHS